MDGLALAVNAARDHGVVNDCARQATAILVKHKPEEYGPSPEALPAIVAPTPIDAPRGYGLLAEVEGVPGRAAGARRADPTLPPLRVRTAGGREEPGPGSAPPTLDPQRRLIQDEPVPSKQKRKGKKKGASDDDEDLLP